MMIRPVLIAILSIGMLKSAYAQYPFLKVEPSSYFGKVSILTGAAWASGETADDHYRLGIRIPLPWRLHLTTVYGYRPVSPYTMVGQAGLQYDIYGSEKRRVFALVDHEFIFRQTHLLFDEKVWKTTIGIGAEAIVISRIGAGLNYAPFGFYHGTRHDNPEKGNPSMTEAGEFRMYLFYCFAPSRPKETPQEEANTKKASNVIFAEVGGAGFVYSVNYERLVRDRVTVRVGAMTFSPPSDVDGTLNMFPILIGSYIGSRSHRLEGSIGATIITASAPKNAQWNGHFPLPSRNGVSVVGASSFGYRFQPRGGGIVFRASVTPFFSLSEYFNWFGLSLGYAF